jgi:hypothetical protein
MSGIACLVFMLVAVVVSAGWSMDLVNMSNKELFELRGAFQNAPEADQEAYQVEWEKRVAAMTDEEKKQFVEPSKEGEGGAGKPKQPFFVPGQGYENQEGQGRVIFGGYPKSSGSKR